MHTQPYLPAPEALPNVDATLAGYLPNSTLYPRPPPEALPNVDATFAGCLGNSFRRNPSGCLPNSTLYECNPKGCACMILEAPTNPPPLLP